MCHILIKPRCLAHIINLATQALISLRSKAKYYDSNAEESHVPDLTATERDEVGLVRSICVKACSSSQRKELFKSVQAEDGIKPLQLLLDMKVRWGSTHAMLLRAESRKEVSFITNCFTNLLISLQQVDSFVYKLSIKETNMEKRRKIRDLTLTEEEWTCIRLFNNLLDVSLSFSYNQPSLTVF